ncbi:hypothetical protein E2C01_071039 [Portunus trituberculatus]|uniref:Uncharacterized protein n=1 Tax=Portunus trituberculatus TaxID=210409 RepID=A0A5B7HYZ1_PORTR|nr:hypothetical protein [Portunus trituberculatus]
MSDFPSFFPLTAACPARRTPHAPTRRHTPITLATASRTSRRGRSSAVSLTGRESSGQRPIQILSATARPARPRGAHRAAVGRGGPCSPPHLRPFTEAATTEATTEGGRAA